MQEDFDKIESMRKKGRPSKYDPKYCGKVVSLMTKGLSKDAVAGKLDISRDTLYEWCQIHEEFSDSIKEGEAKSRYYWEKIGMDGMMGKIKGFRPAVWIFIMKNRFGWRDNVNIQDQTIEPDTAPLDENPNVALDRIIREHGKRLQAPLLRMHSD
jgi:hypothetical protein